MFKSILRLTKQSAIYGIGHVLGKAVVILLLPIHTKFVKPFEYGIATQLLVFLGIMSIIYSYGLNTALLQFFILESDQINRKKYFSTAYITTAITSVGLSILLLVVRNVIAKQLFDSEQYSYLIDLSIGILFFDALILLSKNILRAEERAVSFISLSLLNIVINFILNYVFIVHYSMGVKGIYWANFLASAITFIVLLPITMEYFLPLVSQPMLMRMLKFGLPFLPSTLAIFLVDSVDRLFIKRFLGLEATGIYGASYKVALVIKLVITAFQFAWIPFFLSIVKQENAKQVFSKIFTCFTLLCSLVFLIFCMYMDQIVRFNFWGYSILAKEYWGGTQIVPIVILAYFCFGLYLNFLVGIYFKEKTKSLMYISIVGAILNIMGNFLLIPPFKLMGAAYATLLSYFSMMVLLYFTSQSYYPIPYEKQKILKICIITAGSYLAFKYLLFPYQEIMKIVLIMVYVISLYYSRIFEVHEIQKLKMLIKGFYGKVSAR